MNTQRKFIASWRVSGIARENAILAGEVGLAILAAGLLVFVAFF